MVSSLKELIDQPELAGIDDPEERFTTSDVSRQDACAAGIPQLVAM